MRNKIYRGQIVRNPEGIHNNIVGIMLRVNGKPLCTGWLENGDVIVRNAKKPNATRRFYGILRTLSLYIALAQELLSDAYGNDAAKAAEEFARRHMLNVPVSEWKFTLPEIFAEILEFQELSSPATAEEH